MSSTQYVRGGYLELRSLILAFGFGGATGLFTGCKAHQITPHTSQERQITSVKTSVKLKLQPSGKLPGLSEGLLQTGHLYGCVVMGFLSFLGKHYPSVPHERIGQRQSQPVNQRIPSAGRLAVHVQFFYP
mgnify:CR=1 FL=1